jgi:purine nucleoside phosphorylase
MDKRITCAGLFCASVINFSVHSTNNEAVNQLFIDFKKAYDSVRREALYNTLIEFDIPKKLVRLIKMCLKCTALSGWVRIYLRCFQSGMV